ncbi:hypothetical protein H7Y29_01345 [Microbacteriaceae bacterium]|nr:hypothetical protein [Candidatus Saccharibacteria bacterium]
MKTSRQIQGFHIIEIVLVIAVIGLIGFVGFRFWDASQTKEAAIAPATAKEVAPVEKASDLNKVSTQLDTVDVTGSFESDLNSAGSF